MSAYAPEDDCCIVVYVVVVLCIGGSDRFVEKRSNDLGKMLQLLADCSTDRTVDIVIVVLASEKPQVLH